MAIRACSSSTRSTARTRYRRWATIEATNPCGEVPLRPYETCVLGSVNLAHVVAAGAIDWERLRTIVHAGVRFLDDVVEVNRDPLPEIAVATRGPAARSASA